MDQGIESSVVEGGNQGEPILASAADSPQALRAITEKIVRKLAVIAAKAPPAADAKITRVS